MVIALGKVPTLFGTVINITISGGWVKERQMVSRKGAKEDAKALRKTPVPSLRLCVKYLSQTQLLSQSGDVRHWHFAGVVLADVGGRQTIYHRPILQQWNGISTKTGRDDLIW